MESKSFPSQAEAATILLVESHHIGWDHLKRVLEAEGQLRVIGDPTSPDEAIRAAGRTGPDLIAVAVERTGPWSKEIVERLETVSPASRIIALIDDIQSGVELARERPRPNGVVTWRSTEDEHFLHVVRALRAGYQVVSPEIGKHLSGSNLAGERPPRPLTDLQRDVLLGLLGDMGEEEIARHVAVDRRTVVRAVRELKRKFDARTLQGLVCHAMGLGFRPVEK